MMRFAVAIISPVSSRRPSSILMAALAMLPMLFFVHLSEAQTKEECLACHGEKGVTMERRGKTVELFVDRQAFDHSAHGGLACVDCHVGFNPGEIPHAKLMKPVRCVTCHNDEQFVNFSKSVHGMIRGPGKTPLACADCHTEHTIRNLSAESPEAREQFVLETCAKCHADENARFMASDHGAAVAARVKGAPTCIDCHGEHNVMSPKEKTAQTNRKNIAAMCLKCHVDNPDVRARMGPSAAFISSYENSVHAHAMQNGNMAAATCIDCHGSHDMRKGNNPASSVARRNIASTCGKCHGDILAQYRGSIHGQSFAQGVEASATCTDCHGEHNILSPSNTASPVSARNVAVQVCSRCHESLRLTSKYGLASDRFQSFSDSYHGLANAAGDVKVANCASCHGIHDILPSSDPMSRVNRRNLAKTCGNCHPGANENFSRGAVHVAFATGNERVLYLVSTGYIVLIFVIVGGMAAHNILDFVRKSKRREPGHRLYLRMSVGERVQHGTLLISFFLLVLTGFALRYPNAWWVIAIRGLSPIAFDVRGILHRIAAVALVGGGIYHLYYIFFVPRGKELLRDLLPVRRDVTDAVGILKFNLGFTNTKPKFGRFSYIEKSEYWALVWGTIVMAATGVILWFDNTFLGILTKYWWDVARAVHFYEAWLATLSILVWHFYFVIFDPDMYPINRSFWRGNLTEEEMEEAHPAELERIRRNEEIQKLEASKKARKPRGESGRK